MTWRIGIEHITTFRYTQPAVSSYNEARMTPLTLPNQTTLDARITVSPSATTWTYWDYWGTQVAVFDQLRPHQELTVTATALVETVDGLASPYPTEPSSRSGDLPDEAQEMLYATARTQLAEEQALGLAASLGATKDQTPLAIATWVRENVAYVPGSTGVLTSAREVWEQRTGVCQDIAHLTIGLLRGIGVPARYVSGYLFPGSGGEVGETVVGQSHAWVEWWDEEWVSHDPTNGTVPGERHVVVARGRDYADVPPFKGVYSGGGGSELDVTVRLTRLA